MHAKTCKMVTSGGKIFNDDTNIHEKKKISEYNKILIIFNVKSQKILTLCNGDLFFQNIAL